MNDKESNLVKLIGQRMLSEANDLKRTFSALAEEINIPESKFKKIMLGEENLNETLNVAKLIAENYPISLSSLMLDADDCNNSIRIMRASESKESSRIFSRLNKDGVKAPYYEYRDTAKSKISPFNPEWIKELRLVDDSNPENPDVAYNNGHFLHQMTAFIGPVNFYWEVNGKKFCKEMDTGYSNYITPFWKHSFTTRNNNKEAIIVAVTFWGDVARARNELYTLGHKVIESFKIDSRNNRKGTSQLVQQFLDNNNLTKESLNHIAHKSKKKINLDMLLDEKAEKPRKELEKLTDLLEIPIESLLLPECKDEHEVIVKEKCTEEAYIYNNSNKPDYLIMPLAKNPRMPLMNGFDIEIMAKKQQESSTFKSSLHNFIYNYGDSPIRMKWTHGSKWSEEIIYPEDSLYIQPFISHLFWNEEADNGKLFVFRVSGAVNLTVQKELSSFAETERIIETKPWFD